MSPARPDRRKPTPTGPNLRRGQAQRQVPRTAREPGFPGQAVRSAFSPIELLDEGPVLKDAGEISAALRRARHALQAARKAGEVRALAAALVGMAHVRFRLGQYKEATGLAREALALARDEFPACAEAWQVLGNCAAESGFLSEAQVCYQRAADLAREIGHQRIRAAALHGLAVAVYLPRGQFELAWAAEQEAQRIAREQKRPQWLIYPLVGLALAGHLCGKTAEAREALHELAPLVSPGSIAQGYCLCLSAALALDEGDLAAAQGLYPQARSIAETSGEPWLNIAVRLGISRMERLRGNAAAARAWAEDALDVSTRVGYRQEQGRALIERARAAWLGGELPACERDLEAAIEVLEQVGAAFDLARARFLRAALFHEQGRLEAAAACLAAGRAILDGGYAFLLEQERAWAFPLVAACLGHPDPPIAEIGERLLEQLLRVPPPPLRIYTLGRFEVWQGRRHVGKGALRSRRAGELLALLLLAPGRTLSPDQIAEALWPEKAPTAAQTAFHHATSALRRALEPDLPEKFPSRYLEVEEGQVTLHLPAGSSLDAEEFEAHCRQEEWEEALSLYAGDLLPEYRYADWTLFARERLALLYQRALLGAAGTRLSAGRFAEALDACRELLALEPWQEEAVLLGMQACLGLGDLAGARRLYLALEQTLRRDLNTAPQEKLQAFYRSLTPPQSPIENRKS